MPPEDRENDARAEADSRVQSKGLGLTRIRANLKWRQEI